MNKNNSRKLLAAMIFFGALPLAPSYAFGQSQANAIITTLKIDSQEQHVAQFTHEAWKTNTATLNGLMQIDPHRFDGIKAMYIAKVKANKHLTEELTKNIKDLTPELNINEKTEALLAPVKGFLPKVKILKGIIKPLIEVSLNRGFTEEEIVKLAPEKNIDFNTSLFKKSLETTQDINLFIAEHIKTEDDFKQLCGEFYRVFGDLLNHAFPELKHAFEEMVKHKKPNNVIETEITPAA